MAKKRKNYLEDFNDFKIPIFFLDKLKEFSSGGYILFAITSDGEITKHSHADSEVFALGLTKALERYTEKLESLEATESILKEINGLDDDDEDED